MAITSRQAYTLAMRRAEQRMARERRPHDRAIAAATRRFVLAANRAARQHLPTAHNQEGK